MQDLQSDTILTKSKNFGWNAVTYFDLGNNIRLKVCTRRMLDNNNWQTTVMGMVGEIKSATVTIETFDPNKDFTKVLVRNHNITRATEKNVSDAHAAVIENFDNVYQAAFEFYN